MHEMLFKKNQTDRYRNIYQNQLKSNVARLGKQMKISSLMKKVDSQKDVRLPTEEDIEKEMEEHERNELADFDAIPVDY